MHETWRAAVRHAARSRAAQLPKALSEELSEVAPMIDRVPFVWRLAKIWQYLLVLAFLAGAVWTSTALAIGVFSLGRLPSSLSIFGEASSLPWVLLMMAAVLGLGALSGIAARNLVAMGAGKERDDVEREMRRRVGALAEQLVVEPVEQELARHHEFFTAMKSISS